MDSSITAVPYSRGENPSLPSHKILESHEKLPKKKTSKTEHSTAVSVPSAVEINLLSPLPTSYCPFSVSEKSSKPFQETPYAPIHAVPSEQEEVTEKHVIKGDLTS